MDTKTALLAILVAIPATAAEAGTIKRLTVGCLENSTQDELDRILLNKGVEAFKNRAMEYVILGECDLFQAGERVVEVDSTWTMYKVRRPGAALSYWVSGNAVD